MTDQLKALHKAAQDADDAFSAALQAAYGKRAGDMRYVYAHPAHPEVTRAAAAYRAAGNAYHAAKHQTQPALPGAEAVQSTENPTPEFPAEYSLTPPVAKPIGLQYVMPFDARPDLPDHMRRELVRDLYNRHED